MLFQISEHFYLRVRLEKRRVELIHRSWCNQNFVFFCMRVGGGLSPTKHENRKKCSHLIGLNQTNCQKKSGIR